MDPTRLKYLYQQHQAEALSEAELLEWESIVQDLSQEEIIQELIDSDWHGEETAVNSTIQDHFEQQRIYEYIISQAQQKHKTDRLYKWILYAAAIVLVCSSGLMFWHGRGSDAVQGDVQTAILPGGNKATLILADGRTVDLSETQTGIVVGGELTYMDGSLVLNQKSTPDNRLLTLKIPKGGTYQVTLPDGSKVWLNSESTLKYPSRFTGTQRKVSLMGEAYFDVAKDNKRPFHVVTAGQSLEVFGTQFNVTAYNNESAIKTTLVEGSVRVTNLKTGVSNALRPGQQSVIVVEHTDIINVSTQQFIAWKEGFFSFDATPFPQVLEQLARWYDIEIEYRQKPTKTFSGKMKRDAQLKTVLDFFSSSGIQFRLQGRTLIVE